jgi:hypothetical protein
LVWFCKVNPFCWRISRICWGPSWQRTPSSWSGIKSLVRASCKIWIYEKQDSFMNLTHNNSTCLDKYSIR